MNPKTPKSAKHICTDDCGTHGKHTQLRQLTDLTARLRSKSRKVTGPRQLILDWMRQHRHPAAIKEIFNSLGVGDCDLATIYRSMHLLQEMGLVKRFDFGDGIARYEMIGEGPEAHHHHLVCTQCSKIVELDDCFAKELESSVAKKHGFKSVTHNLEFFGICPSCQPLM